MTSQVWWYLARASGAMAWVMLTASVVWGIILSTKAFPKHRRPAWLLDLHRWLGTLTLALIGLHIASLIADTYTDFDIAAVLVPFASEWRPFAVAVGVIAGWLIVTIQISSLAIKRLPRRVWHGIHLASYAVFWLTSLHAVLAGSDRAEPLYLTTAAIGTITVVWATIYRITHPRPTRPAPATHPTSPPPPRGFQTVPSMPTSPPTRP